ncbi:LLM class flavin-dependent oxidoreductase [Microbacterium tumbae]
MSVDLGFLVFLNYDEDADARQALEDGLSLFEHAEALGYDSAGIRIHHGVRTLSSPFPFLTVAALRTERIRLATGIIPIGWEDPLRFAEDAATADLFSGGRLDLGLSSGFIKASEDPGDRTRRVEERLSGIIAAVRGEALGDAPFRARDVPVAQAVSDGDVVPLPHGPYGSAPEQLHAFPRSPGLENRLGYGAGSLSSALRAARRASRAEPRAVDHPFGGDRTHARPYPGRGHPPLSGRVRGAPSRPFSARGARALDPADPGGRGSR